MRHRHPPVGNQLNFAGVEPDAVRDHRSRRLEEAEVVERKHRPLAVAGCKFGKLDFRLTAMGVESGVVFFRKLNGATLSGLIGVEQVLQPDPDVDAAVGLAVPRLDQGLVHVERVEIVVVRMLADIGHRDQPIANGFRRSRTAFHEPPHVDHGRGAAQHGFGVTQP